MKDLETLVFFYVFFYFDLLLIVGLSLLETGGC